MTADTEPPSDEQRMKSKNQTAWKSKGIMISIKIRSLLRSNCDHVVSLVIRPIWQSDQTKTRQRIETLTLAERKTSQVMLCIQIPWLGRQDRAMCLYPSPPWLPNFHTPTTRLIRLPSCESGRTFQETKATTNCGQLWKQSTWTGRQDRALSSSPIPPWPLTTALTQQASLVSIFLSFSPTPLPKLWHKEQENQPFFLKKIVQSTGQISFSRKHFHSPPVG